MPCENGRVGDTIGYDAPISTAEMQTASAELLIKELIKIQISSVY